MGPWGGQRAVLQQCESFVQPRILRGGARFYRAGMDAAGPVALRGQAFSLPPRESVGAAVSETASSNVDSGNAQPGDGALVRGKDLSVFWPGHVARTDLRLVGLLRGRGRQARLRSGFGKFWLRAADFRRRD